MSEASGAEPNAVSGVAQSPGNALARSNLPLTVARSPSAACAKTRAATCGPPLTPACIDSARHVFNFTSVSINQGATVKFIPNRATTPVFILTSGDVTISGEIDVSGARSPRYRCGRGWSRRIQRWSGGHSWGPYKPLEGPDSGLEEAQVANRATSS